MSYSYQEIYQEGVEKGLATTRALLQAQIARRFPRDPHRLDALLARCDDADLLWLGDELLSARSVAVLERDLAARLLARG